MSKAPKLRFKKFSGDWEEKKLQNVSDVRDGTHDSPKYVTEGYPFVTSKNLMKNGKIDFSDISYITEEDYININKRSKVDVGDILFGMIGTIGNPVIVEQDGFAIKNVALIKEKDKLLNRYLIQVLKSSVIDRQFYKLNTGGTQKFIGLGMIRDLSILIPSIEEQEKIAFFFSLIDDKISLQGEKVEALKDYKKGMMQKIFSRELRFKDDEGRDYPEWEEKKLESIVSKKKKGKNAIYAESGNILLNNEYMENSSEPLYVENEIDVNEEDILILWDGSQAGKMYTGFTGVLGSTFVAITLDKYNCNRFIHQQLMYNLDKIQLAWREGSGVPHVAKDFIENFKIKVPVLDEQRKIANILYSIDIKIEKEQEKLDSLKQYKKGLLQQMFV